MKAFQRIKNAPSRIAALATTVLLSSPAFADDDGFSKATALFTKIASALTGTLAVATLTCATCWVGYKVMWDGRSLGEFKNIIIGAICIGGASGLASYLLAS